MAKPETGILVTVYCGDYEYKINPNFCSLEYIDENNNVLITFGSKEEMKAVAEGMLKALEFTK